MPPTIPVHGGMECRALQSGCDDRPIRQSQGGRPARHEARLRTVSKPWLPFQDTSKTILLFVSDEARKTISRYRASARTSSIWQPVKSDAFASDAPLSSPREPTHGIRKRERDRAERIRLAGGPKPSLRERAVALAREKGEVRTKDLTDIGVHRCYLSRMCVEGLLVKVGFGRYRAARSRKKVVKD